MEWLLLLLVARGSYIDAILKLLRVKESGGNGVPIEDPPFESVDSLKTKSPLVIASGQG